MKVMSKTITLRTPLPERASFAEKRRAADLLDRFANEMLMVVDGREPDGVDITAIADDAKPTTMPDPPGALLAPIEPDTIAETMGKIGRQVAGEAV